MTAKEMVNQPIISLSVVKENMSSRPSSVHEEEDGTQTPGAGPSRPISRQSSRSSRSSQSSKGKDPERANGVEPVDGSVKSAVNGHAASETESEDEDDSGDEDEEEDEEPTLKYARLKGAILEILDRDTASTIEVGARTIAIGTHNGMVHILTYEGAKVTSYRPHRASVTCLRMDEEGDFIATSSVEGEVIIHSLTTPESYKFDYKRPMKAVALEPGFGKKNSRGFVCGGMAGKLILQEKGWLGYKETVLHSGEGPIWAIEWRGNLIAWANDLGVKIYDTASGQRIGYVDRGDHAPRAELFKCSLLWKDDSTLVIAWADHIKVIRIRTRSRSQIDTGMPNLTIEMTGIFQVDCMISGVALFNSSYVVLAYVSPDSYENEATDSREEQRRKAANRPELRVIDKGEEVAADALSLSNFHNYGCNDYVLVKSRRHDDELFFVVSPSEVIEVRPRDEADHVKWLLDRERYEEALSAAEALQAQHGSALDVKAIGTKYMHHLIHQGQHARAAALATKVFGQDIEAWTACIQTFLDHDQLSAILPEVPTSSPQLPRQTYEMILGSLLVNDKQALLATIKSWPTGIYDANAVMGNVQGELDATRDDPILLECMGELYLANRQPGRALPYFLRLRQPRVFDLIREFNLFTAIQDQALLLVEFDQETKDGTYGPAVQLLVDHIHSIPIERVVRQLEERPQYLFLYLRCVFDKDPQLCFPYSDRMISLSATYDPSQLLPFLRASNSYDLEQAYNICKEHDFVPEMVFLLGRMGNNRQALMLIIERLGDVQRAIDFATEQADEDLWEDLLQYSETRPDFIRALLERVGAEINPIRLIRRIKDGMEIPGLKAALIKIVQASNLQVSLSEGTHRILSGDCSSLATELQVAQTNGVHGMPSSTCAVCGQSAFARDSPMSGLVLVYLCRHLVHAQCSLLNEDVELPARGENASVSYLLSGDRVSSRKRELGGKLSFAAAVRVRVGRCPVCTHSRGSAIAA